MDGHGEPILGQRKGAGQPGPRGRPRLLLQQPRPRAVHPCGVHGAGGLRAALRGHHVGPAGRGRGAGHRGCSDPHRREPSSGGQEPRGASLCSGSACRRQGTSRFEVTRHKGQTSTVKNSPSEVSAVTKATSTDCLALRGFLFTVRLRPHHPLARCTPPLPGPPCQGLCSPKSEGTAT